MTLHLITTQRIKIWLKSLVFYVLKDKDVKLSFWSVLEIKATVKNQLKCESVAVKELYLSESNVALNSTSEVSTKKISDKIYLHYISKILNTRSINPPA